MSDIGLRIMTDDFPGCPKEVPWSMLDERHQLQAEKNHYQSLRRLDQRGGVCPTEFQAIAMQKDFYELFGNVSPAMFGARYDAVNFLRAFIGELPLPPRDDPEIVAWRKRRRV